MSEEIPIVNKLLIGNTEDIEEEYLEKRKIKKIFVDGEKVYIKKSWLGFKIVNPIKIDGKINWKNLIAGGSWWKLVGIAFIVIVILGCVMEYSIALKTANDCLNKSRALNVSSLNLSDIII